MVVAGLPACRSNRQSFSGYDHLRSLTVAALKACSEPVEFLLATEVERICVLTLCRFPGPNRNGTLNRVIKNENPRTGVGPWHGRSFIRRPRSFSTTAILRATQ